MRINRNLPVWVLFAGIGTALGWGLHCQTPTSHLQVRMGEDCQTCHEADYLNAQQPLHIGELSRACGDCHSNTSWSPARGSNHSWPLDGAHAATSCSSCHGEEPAVYEGTATDCVGCHAEQKDTVVEPPHLEFSDDCSSCHQTGAWQPAAFAHSWPLEGAHASTSCSSCHGQEPAAVYVGTATDCIGCHSEQKGAVVEPSHLEFSDDCSSCHQTGAWQPAAFAHSWPLEGAHASTSCAGCHGSPPTYQGTATDCNGCHADDRALAISPPHEGFSSDCSSCHGTLSWDSASFVHTSQFPLLGAHQPLECAACHTGSPAVFAGTSSACVSCHQQDYDQSPFPGHSTFATTCQDCHRTSGWVPAAGGSHPQNLFSITGRHNYPCNDCHNPSLGPNGAGNADCVGCHEGEHTLARMDGEHVGEVRNYPTGANRAPNFCLQCHADGNE